MQQKIDDNFKDVKESLIAAFVVSLSRIIGPR